MPGLALEEALYTYNPQCTAGPKTLRFCKKNYWCREEINNQVLHRLKLTGSKTSLVHTVLNTLGLGKLVVQALLA